MVVVFILNAANTRNVFDWIPEDLIRRKEGPDSSIYQPQNKFLVFVFLE